MEKKMNERIVKHVRRIYEINVNQMRKRYVEMGK
jgi:hypothetical protein